MMVVSLIASCISKGAVRQKVENWIFFGIITAMRRNPVLAFVPLCLRFATSHPWLVEADELQRRGISCYSDGARDGADFPGSTGRRWPAQNVSVCSHHPALNIRTGFFVCLILENAVILQALVSIMAFRIRWSNIHIQRSRGMFVYLFVLFVC